MATIPCNLAEFRVIAKELLSQLPATNTPEQVDLGIKCMALAYLGLQGNETDRLLSVGIYQYVCGKAIDRETELILQRFREVRQAQKEEPIRGPLQEPTSNTSPKAAAFAPSLVPDSSNPA